MLARYDPVGQPHRPADPRYGDYTPLTGSLTNVAEYLRSYIDTDPYSKCGRGYYVMLLTDGEEQPVLPGNDPVGAVTALRNLVSTGGIVGGREDLRDRIRSPRPSPQLNAMARAGGHRGDAQRDHLQRRPGERRRPSTGRAPMRSSSLEVTFGKILRGLLHPVQAGGEPPGQRDVRAATSGC